MTVQATDKRTPTVWGPGETMLCACTLWNLLRERKYVWYPRGCSTVRKQLWVSCFSCPRWGLLVTRVLSCPAERRSKTLPTMAGSANPLLFLPKGHVTVGFILIICFLVHRWEIFSVCPRVGAEKTSVRRRNRRVERDGALPFSHSPCPSSPLALPSTCSLSTPLPLSFPHPLFSLPPPSLSTPLPSPSPPSLSPLTVL